MLIRKIESADNQSVAAIIRSVMTEFDAVGPGYSIEDPEVDAIYEAYTDSQSVFYVLEENQELVGCAGIGPLKGLEDSICELQKMYFLPQARGRGLGRILGEMLVVDAQRSGYQRMYVETLQRMAAARRLYEKMGFERLEEPLGNTGHCSCDLFYALDIEPAEIAADLLR